MHIRLEYFLRWISRELEIRTSDLLSFSTVKNELLALGLVTAETVWIIELFDEIGFIPMCDVLCENEPTIQSVLYAISDLGARYKRSVRGFCEVAGWDSKDDA